MSFPYPAKPWQDGQQVNVAMADGTYVIGQYDASKNLWSFRRFRDDQVNREQIFTFDVLTTTSQPAPRDLSPFDTSDPTNLQTQQEVNWFLWNYIRDLELEGAQIAFSTEATMLQAPANIDETFERDVNDLDQYGPALFYINAPDHDGATRIVVPKVDTEGFNWTPILRAYGVDDIILTVQVDDLGTPDDSSDDLNYRSEWRIISDPVENQYSFSFEVKHIKDNPNHLPSFGENVYVRLLASQGYVLKTGDTMTGTLEIANEGDATNLDFDPDKANLTFTTTKTDGSASESVSIHQNGLNSSLGITGGVVADGSYYSQSGRYYGSDPSGPYFAARPPFLQLEQTEGTLQWNSNARVKWDALGGSLQWGDSARLEWNEFNVEIPKPVEDDVNRDGFIVRGTTADGYETDDPLDEDGKLLSTFHNANKADAVNYAGKIVAPSNLVNKGYVDEKDEILQQEILELEEEIDAIAPSTQRGEWHFDKDKNFPDPGDYYLLKGASGASPEVTDKYNEADGVVFHNVDANGVINTWSNVQVDELIQIFDKPDPDFVLGTITNVYKNKVSNAVWIEFDRISGEGSPNNNQDIKLSRLNIFEAPSGGDASGFVLKTGDTMTGNLTIDKSTGAPGASYLATLTLTGERSNTTYAASKIQFKNAQSTTVGELHYKSYDGNSWFTFTQDVDLNSKGLHSAARLRLNSGGYIGAGSDERIKIRTGGGNDNQAGTEIQRFGENKRIFAIRGKIKDATSESDILWAYTNTGKTGDAINYRGLITHDYHITNRGYVRNNYVKGNYTITKSNGNYYIQ